MEVTLFDFYSWFFVLLATSCILLLWSKRMRKLARGSRPIWLTVGMWTFVLLAITSVLYKLDRSGLSEEILELIAICIAGGVIGQSCFIAIVSGLRWWSWAAGYVLGVVVIVSVGSVVLTFAGWRHGTPPDEAVAGLTLFPALLLSLTSVLVALRYVCGWRIIAIDEAAPQRDTFRIEDLFALTAIVAMNLILPRVLQLTVEEEHWEFWGPVLVMCGVCFAIGLLVLPVCVWLTLNTRNRLVAIVGLILLPVLVPGVIFGIGQIAMFRETDESERLAILKPILAVCGGATVSLYLSLFILARCGMSLVRSVKASRGSGAASDSKNRDTRWVTAGAIIVAVFVSVGLARVEQQRKTIDAENSRLSELSKRLDGEIFVYQRKVRQISLGRRATDRDLEQYRFCRDAMSIDLSDSAVTDLGLALLKHFPKTNSLKLNSTQVSDAGLATLNGLRELERLELEKTRIAGGGFANVDPLSNLVYIELSDSQFDDDGCRALRRFANLGSISLAGTRVTDAGIRQLNELSKLSFLYISRTDIRGDGLSALTQLSWLTLNDTKVDDTSISNIVHLTSLSWLDLANTAISDAAVERLAELPTLHQLDLTGTAVTGAGFRAWVDRGQLKSLTLSRTALADVNVKHLRQFSPLEQLDVSETQIGDACLPDLAQMQIDSLNIGDTKITAEGLLAAGMVTVRELRVFPRQFTDIEIQQLERQFTITEVVGLGDESSDD